MTRSETHAAILRALAEWHDGDVDLLRRLVAIGAPSALCQSLCDDTEAAGEPQRGPRRERPLPTARDWARAEAGGLWRELSRQRGDRRT